MPFQPSGTIAQLLLKRGQARADAELESGRAWGQGLQNIAHIASGTIADLARARQDAPRQKFEAMRFEKAEREHRGQEVMRGLQTRLTDPQTGRLDHRTLISELTTAGYPELAESTQTKVRVEQDRLLTGVMDRLDQHKTIYGKAPQLLQEADADPTVWPRLRPMLVEMASHIDPAIAEKIPTTYDAERVKQMTAFVTASAAATDTRLKGLSALKASQAATDDAVKRDQLHRTALSNWFSTATSPEDWTAVADSARSMDIPEETIRTFGDWGPEATARAIEMGMSPAERAKAREGPELEIGAGSNRVNDWRAAVLLKEGSLGRKLSKEERGAAWAALPKTTTTSEISAAATKNRIAALRKNPALWNGFTSGARDAILADPDAADIAALVQNTGQTVTATTRATAEARRRTAISALNKEYRVQQPPMSEVERDDELQQIEDSYRIQLGQQPLPRPGGRPGRSVSYTRPNLKTSPDNAMAPADVTKHGRDYTLLPAPPSGPPVAPPVPTRPPVAPTPPSGVQAVPPAAREEVRQILRSAGYADTDANIDTFLKNPKNRRDLGIP